MEFQETNGRIWVENEEGRLVAEITFPETRPGVADVDHTFVDASLRGQGAAELGRGMKAVLTCSYAKKWFGDHPEQGDLLAQ